MSAETPRLVIFGHGPVLNKTTREHAGDSHTKPGEEDMSYVGYNLAMAGARLVGRREVGNVFVTGGRTGGSQYAAESELIAREMERWGVSHENVNYETVSESTVENFVQFVNCFDSPEAQKTDAPIAFLGLKTHTTRLRLFAKIFGVPVLRIYALEDVLGGDTKASSGRGVEQVDSQRRAAMEGVWIRHILSFPARLLEPCADLKDDSRIRRVVEAAHQVYGTEELAKLGVDPGAKPDALRAALRSIRWPIHTPEEQKEIVATYLKERWPTTIQDRFELVRTLSWS